ncbi:hypothetical protein FDUTEX481_02875 [Tolypothrix sp. PCC 7601]|nr:hypothetical protein FDUTEX481_02875 [Tolypothrix sp. PCC 7601]
MSSYKLSSLNLADKGVNDDLLSKKNYTKNFCQLNTLVTKTTVKLI